MATIRAVCHFVSGGGVVFYDVITRAWRSLVFLMTSTCDGVRRKRELTFAESSAAPPPFQSLQFECRRIILKCATQATRNFVQFCILNTAQHRRSLLETPGATTSVPWAEVV